MRFAHETARAVETEYVSKGLVKITFIDFALHGEPAVNNAEAAQCAQDQGQFWAYVEGFLPFQELKPIIEQELNKVP